VTRYDTVVDEATAAAGLAAAFGDKLVETIVDEGPMHRLWHDLRTQSMFEPELRAAVLTIDEALEAMVWRIVGRYAQLAGTRPAVLPATAYAMFDGSSSGRCSAT
jgi:TetR/AcrR family transcriptional regulator, transcriptional repressor of bet genes